MYRKFIILVLLLFISCKNHHDVKIVNPDAQKSLEIVIDDLDPESKKNFIEAYKNILSLGARGPEGKSTVISIMEKKYEDITLGDILKIVEE